MSEEYKTIKFSGTEVRCYREGYIALYKEETDSIPAGWYKTFGSPGWRGYMFIRIGTNTVAVHRLINLAFNADSYKKDYVTDHINRVKNDNRAENLRWVTLSENAKNSDYQDSLRVYRETNKTITVMKPNGKTSSRSVSKELFDILEKMSMSDRYKYIVDNQIKPLHRRKSELLYEKN